MSVNIRGRVNDSVFIVVDLRPDICSVTHRWKGENVATTEVTDHLLMVDCIEEANVYGVTVPGKSVLLRVSAS